MSAMPEPNGVLGLVGIDDETQARMREALATAANRARDYGHLQSQIGGTTEQEAFAAQMRMLNSQRARQMRDYFQYSPVGQLENAAGLEAMRYAAPIGGIALYGGRTAKAVQGAASSGVRGVLPQAAANRTLNFVSQAERSVLGPLYRTATFGSPRALTAGQSVLGPVASPMGLAMAGSALAKSVTADHTTEHMVDPITYGPEPEPSALGTAYAGLKTARKYAVKPMAKMRDVFLGDPLITRLEEKTVGK